jgi:hypothetical protein
MRRRIFAIFAAFLIVSAGAAGPASAQSMTDLQCDGLAGFIKNAVAMGLTGTPNSECVNNNDAIDELKDLDGNQTKVDIYDAGVSTEASEETFLKPFQNSLQDSGSVAWMKTQVAVAEAYENGSSQNSANVSAREAISGFYTVKQINLIERWNASMQEYQGLNQTAAQEDGIGDDYVSINLSKNDFGGQDNAYLVLEGFEPRSVELANGTHRDVMSMHFTYQERDSDGSTDYDKTVYINPTTSHTGINPTPTPPATFDVNGFHVAPPNDNYDGQVYFEIAPYVSLWDQTETLNSNLQDEAALFVDSTYQDFESGQINASDVISANTAMFEYGTEYSDSDSLYNAVGALSMMGFDTPNMSSSGTMDVSYNGNTYTGIVLARNAPNGSWQNGTTYNTSNITGPVFLATVDGEKIDFDQNAEFTIESMRAKDGSNVETVETTEYVYKTANTSELLEMQEQLTDLRQEVEEREAAIGGGGGFLGGSSNTMIAIVALAGAALLLGRSNQ